MGHLVNSAWDADPAAWGGRVVQVGTVDPEQAWEDWRRFLRRLTYAELCARVADHVGEVDE